MGDAHLAGHLGPEAEHSVDPPVADADEPEREAEPGETEQRDHDVGGAGREDGQGRDHVSGERWPDEVRSGERVPGRVRERIDPVEQELRLRVELVVEVGGKRVCPEPDDQHPDEREDRQHTERDDDGDATQRETVALAQGFRHVVRTRETRVGDGGFHVARSSKGRGRT